MIKKKVFNGKKLKIARVYRAKTVEMLAKEIKVNKKDILAFEDNKYRPTPENTEKIVKALKFPKEHFFETESKRVILEGSHFNSQSTLPRVEEMSFREKMIMLHRIHYFVDKYREFPKLNFPKMNKNSEIEDLASLLRSHWNLGNRPTDNLVEVMEKNGIILSDINSNNKFATTFTQKQSIENDVSYLICLGNDNNTLAIRNNDLAYELGFILSNELKISSKKFNKDEFCAAFLLPKDEFVNDLKDPSDLNEYIQLKQKWKTPIVTMLFRSYQLGKLGYKKYNYLLNEIQNKGWLTKEPLDESMPAIKPSLLKQNIEYILNHNSINKSEFYNMLSEVDVLMNEADINLLIG